MKHSRSPFRYNDNEIKYLYERHQLHGYIDDGINLASFKGDLITTIQDSITLIFSALPKAPAIAKAFFNHLSDDEFDLVSGLANLISYKPHNFPIELNSSISPDICLIEHNGVLFSTCFDRNNTDLLQLTHKLVRFYWQNFNVQDIEALSDEEQLCLLRHLDILDTRPEAIDTKQHKKLVFGLHIPQELKLYHKACIEELAVRILTSPVYAGIFESILEQKNCTTTGLPYLTDTRDKDIFCSIFMQEMAEIWGIPTPIRKDFDQKKKMDNNGNPFIAIMHAYYIPRKYVGQKPGLYYGFNKQTGIMERQDYNDIKAIAHEFAHLVSAFLRKGQSNPAFLQKEPRLKHTRIPSLDHLAAIFETNNSSTGLKRYYQQIGTDFSGLPKPEGKNEYKGQIEERHADWLGEKIAETIEFALLSRRTLRNIDLAKSELHEQFDDILKNLGLTKKEPALDKDIRLSIQAAQNFEELSHATQHSLSLLRNWQKHHMHRPPDAHAGQRAHSHDKDAGTAGKQAQKVRSHTLARQQIYQLGRTTERLFHFYRLYSTRAGLEDHNSTHLSLPLDENRLSHSS